MNKTVLIVEDEYIVARDLRLTLEKAGYQVNGIAASAIEAEELIRKQVPDLVLLDIRLQGAISGIDLAKKLKAGNIAFIYLSAYSNQKILEEAKATDPYGFLVKPFREKDLLITLDIAWYRHHHSYESTVRRKETLHQKLAEIADDTSTAEQKLLKLARVMQPFIPFDLIVSAPGPLQPIRPADKAYLRIGFDEYQFISRKELLNIRNVKAGDFSSIAENNHAAQPVIYTVDVTTEKPAVTDLVKILSDTFNLQSYLAFPIHLPNGAQVYYFFYSRQRTIYTDAHIALLNQLKKSVTAVTEKMMAPGPVNLSNTRLPVNEGNAAFPGVVGNHHLLLSALDLAAQVAHYNTSVLILGESGTGKEKVAQVIHELSPKRNGPFIKVNCAAIPATLIESELFGHEKGAFTGAIEKRKGRFEQAHDGTIFLDEIGELPLSMQVKLLRVLQEKEIEPVGGRSIKKVNVRIVAATNKNLEKEVAEGKFRLDLYYRLNAFPITLPPLRERKSDLEALALFFANRFCKEFNKPFTGIGQSMMKQLYAYDWPGNIRELENIIEQSVILHDGQSTLELKRDLTATITGKAEKAPINTLEDVKHIQRETERDYIISVLKQSKGRIRGVNGAAALLNIKPSTLESKMAKLNINRKDFMSLT